MDWTRGYTAHWRVFVVDRSTWADAGTLDNVRSVSIERDVTSEAPMIESGSILLDQPIGDTFEECYLRVVMTAEQDGAERVDVATLWCTAASGDVHHGADAVELIGRSVLHPANVRKLVAGTYAPKGANGAEWVGALLREVCAAPVVVEGSFTLVDHVVFETEMTYLECAWLVLDAGRFCIQIGGDGTIYVRPMPTDPGVNIDTLGAQLLQPSVAYELDYSDVPNQYTAREGVVTATVTNNDPNSPTSTASRGFVHNEVDTSPVRVNGETLEQYAARQLELSSMLQDTRVYTREYYPGVLPFSIVRGSLASVQMEGDLRVVTQSLACERGITIREKAIREVYTWQR